MARLVERISKRDPGLWEGDRFGEERTTVMGKKIAVLVPAHNEEDNLPLSLPSAVGQVGPEHVYVVDDNSSDRTRCVALGYIPNVYSSVLGVKFSEVLDGIECFNYHDRY